MCEYHNVGGHFGLKFYAIINQVIWKYNIWEILHNLFIFV